MLKVKFQTSSFNNDLMELQTVAKEIHFLFVKDVKTICENINLKTEECRTDMAKEIAALDHNYSSLHSKVKKIVDAVTNVVEWYNSLLPKVDKKAEVDVRSFGKIKETLNNLK